MLKIGTTIIDSEKVKKYWQECCSVIPKDQKTKEMLQKVFIYAKNKIIETTILEKIIEKEENEISFEEIQKEYKRIIAEKKITELSKESKYALQSQIEKDLKIRALLDKWQNNILPPTDEECLKYYEVNKNQFRENEKFIFKAVIVNKKCQEPQKKIEYLYQIFCKKGDFDDLEKYQTKEIEYKKKLAIEKNILPSEIENALLTMEQGDTSPIIESGDSYSFFQYIEYFPEGVVPYLSTKEKVKHILLSQKKEKNKKKKIAEYKKKNKVIDELKIKNFDIDFS